MNQNPSRVTDERIRDFLTQTVRENQKDIFDSIHYEALIEHIHKINSTANEEDTEGLFGELFVDTFSSEEFMDTLKKLLKDKWYKKLEIFYQ